MLEFKLKGDEGGHQGRIGANSDGFLRHWTRGASTLDLIVYRVPDGVRTDGPGFSLCAAPLESFDPGFQDRRVDRMNERRSGVYRTGDGRGITEREGVEADSINGKL